MKCGASLQVLQRIDPAAYQQLLTLINASTITPTNSGPPPGDLPPGFSLKSSSCTHLCEYHLLLAWHLALACVLFKPSLLLLIRRLTFVYGHKHSEQT